MDDFTKTPPKNRVYEGYTLGHNGLIFGPQGSLRASATDLANFAMMLMNSGNHQGRQVLKKSSIDLLTDNHWTFNGSNGDTWDDYFLSYGFGLHRLTNKSNADIIYPDHQMVGHPGIAYGLLSDMYFDRAQKNGIIFITNGSKKAYAYGQQSTFYQIEEEVFAALSPIFQESKAQ